jgi:hypothetical protein
MTSEELSLQMFGQHCRWFYDSSLVLRPTSSSSLASMHDEKKADDMSIRANTNKNHKDGKIVIEALDRIIAIRSIVVSIQQQTSIMNELQNSIDILRTEHALIAERHHETLAKCGVLDLDHIIEEESSSLLQKYTQMRDATRRRAHKISMLHRQNSLFELLLESIPHDEPVKPRMNQMHNIQHTLSTIKKFVRNYQSNIGSHPFLAGLHRIVDLQLIPKPDGKRSSKDSSYIVRWRFHGSVLMEACRSCHGKDENDQNDDLAYARDAIEVIFSFLIWIKDIDVESRNGPDSFRPELADEINLGLDVQSFNSTYNEKSEPFLSFEIDKHISNATLRRIHSVLPNPKFLDARATGSVEVLDASLSDPQISYSGVVQRRNVHGQEDEQFDWFSRMEFCALL